MKYLLTLALVSLNAFAGNLYSVKEITYDTTHNLKAGDVVFCSSLDMDHRLVGDCVPLSLLEKSNFSLSSTGEVILNESLAIGSVTGQTFAMDDLDSGSLTEIAINPDSNFDIKLVTKKGLRLNKDMGCSAPFECDWHILIPSEKLFLKIFVNDKMLDVARVK